jgi:hypothetical protein
VLTPEDYRQLAERFALLAFECATPGVAEELKTFALDYLTRSISPMVKRPINSEIDPFAFTTTT